MPDAPAPQNEIVLNCQTDYQRIEHNRLTYQNPRFRGGNEKLYPPKGNDLDLTIYAGDLIYTSKRQNVRKRTYDQYRNEDPQQPYVLASLNDFEVTTAELKNARGVGLRKIRNVIKNKISVVGTSKKVHKYENGAMETTDNPVALMYGMTRTLNNGPETIELMDYVVWDVPPPHDPPVVPSVQEESVTPTTRKLIKRPLRLTSFISVEDILNYICACELNESFIVDCSYRINNISAGTTDDDDKLNQIQLIWDEINCMLKKHDCEEYDILMDYLEICSDSYLYILKNNKEDKSESGKKILKISCDVLMLTGLITCENVNGLENMLNTIHEESMDMYERIIGRCARSAQPGEYLDLIVNSF